MQQRIIARLAVPRLLALAACGHVCLTLALYLIGRFKLMPDAFDENGIGIIFAADCLGYRIEAVSLIDTLTKKGVLAWLAATSEYLVNPFHLKLYSLSFAVCGRLFGYNILSAEPLNLLYYLSILWLVFALGKEAFDLRAGLLAAALVAVWPSFLLHSTQLFRDPLFIAAMLLLVLVVARLLNKNYSWPRSLRLGAIGSIAACLLLLLRREMWEVLVVTALAAVCLLAFRQLREKRFLAGNTVGCALLFIVILGLPRIERMITTTNDAAPSLPVEVAAVAETLSAAPTRNTQTNLFGGREENITPPGTSLPLRISHLREKFIKGYPSAKSNIDTDVIFVDWQSVARYLPRATVIGLFAPFPNMWLKAGTQVGLKGRLLSGLETLFMYVLELAAVIGLWRGRRNPSVWLLLIVAGAGMVALGLVVINIATLYRMRYIFWILIIIIGAGGISGLFPGSAERKQIV